MLISSLIAILLSNATAGRRDLAVDFNRNMLIVLFGAMIIGLKSIILVALKEGVSLLGGLYHNTSLTISFHVFIIFISLIIIQLTGFYPRKYILPDLGNSLFPNNVLKTPKNVYYNNCIQNLQLSSKVKELYTIIEYPLIILFIILGAMFLISSSDIISIFISIELQSYGLYLICALYRNSELSTGAGLIYFLLGGLSSCFILLSFGILYTFSGTSNMDSYYILTNLSDAKDSTVNLIYWYNNNYINYSLVIMSVGFLFKISAAPFHFWSPDVYDAIPTVVTTFVANIAKLSILVYLVEIVHSTGNISTSDLNWTNSLLLSSLLSLIIGTVLGLDQSRIKKLLAYSTISHLGFMLLAISINSIESTQALIFYLMQYSISNVNAFIIIISIGYTLFIYREKKFDINTKKVKNEKEKQDIEIKKEKEYKELVDENNSPIQYISQLKGYYYINPLIAISLVIVIYSFVGIPPLVGFFAKQMVLSSALDKGFIFITLVAILTSVISAVYYLNIVKQIFFDKPDYQKIDLRDLNEYMNFGIKDLKLEKGFNVVVSTNLSLTISALTLIILLFMFNPEQWLSIANILAILMFY